MSTQFQPINEKRIFEKIVGMLKQKVFSGEFRPGDRLPAERELANSLRVSRLSVREAYRALELFGMLEIRRGNGGGAFICVPHRKTIFESISDFFRLQGISLEEWVEARLLLELDIAKLAINRADDRDYERLEGWVKKAFHQIEAGIPAHQENVRFHLCLAEVAGNPILLTVYGSLMDLELDTLKALSADLEQSRDVAMDHAKIINTLKSRNTDRLSKVIEEHVRGSAQRLITISKRSPLFNGGLSEDKLSLKQKEMRYSKS